MPFINVTRKGDFLERLARRADTWASHTRMEVRLRVPPELSWWYWNEFGTATKRVAAPERQSGAVVSAPGAPTGKYPIRPSNAKMLRYPWEGKIVFRENVEHPGIVDSHSVGMSLPEIEQSAAANVNAAFHQEAADNPEVLKAALWKTAEEAKSIIVMNMITAIPGRREVEPERGRLGGRSAASVFDEGAYPVDVSQ